MANRCEINEKWWWGTNRLNQTRFFFSYVAWGMSEVMTPLPQAEQQNIRREKRPEVGWRRKDTLITNATGHRPSSNF